MNHFHFNHLSCNLCWDLLLTYIIPPPRKKKNLFKWTQMLRFQPFFVAMKFDGMLLYKTNKRYCESAEKNMKKYFLYNEIFHMYEHDTAVETGTKCVWKFDIKYSHKVEDWLKVITYCTIRSISDTVNGQRRDFVCLLVCFINILFCICASP